MQRIRASRILRNQGPPAPSSPAAPVAQAQTPVSQTAVPAHQTAAAAQAPGPLQQPQVSPLAALQPEPGMPAAGGNTPSPYGAQLPGLEALRQAPTAEQAVTGGTGLKVGGAPLTPLKDRMKALRLG